MGDFRLFDLPERVQTRRLWRLAFLIGGAWTCGFACTSLLTPRATSLGHWASNLVSVLLFATLGCVLGLVFALPILWRTDVRKSVLFVWVTSFGVWTFALVFGEQLRDEQALHAAPWVGMVAAMLAARLVFPWPPR